MAGGRREPSYALRVEGHRVYCDWRRPLEEWTGEEQETYLPALREAVRRTVGPEATRVLTKEGLSQDPEYQAYVRTVRDALVVDFDLQDRREEVTIGLYHGDMLVLSFPAAPGIEYPYYYRGIQLKPYLVPTEPPAIAL